MYPFRMRFLLTLMLLSAPSIFGFGAKVVRIVREPGTVAFSLQNGYGVQKNGKHQLIITDAKTGRAVSTIRSFKGKTAAADGKYFDRLDAIQIPVNSGKLHISGRIFYCSFEEKFCSVQRVDEDL
jgi:hypothetical protein